MTASDVLEGRRKWSCECTHLLPWLSTLPDDSIDLLVTSPFYEDARTYGLDERLPSGQAWVDFMVAVVRAAAPKVTGLIAINCEGKTKDYSYSGVPFLLFADLKRAGFNMRKPPIFHRIGIPGSGGPDWVRNDYEPIVCVTRPGKLLWSDNTACGHPPKWAPGGEMSHRITDGQRRNERGRVVDEFGNHNSNCCGRDKDRPRDERPGLRTKGTGTSGKKNGDIKTVADIYDPPVLANPGNSIEQRYTAKEVAEMMGEPNDVLSLNVGGGQMGHSCSHDNEAPFPLDLPLFFIKSFAPPNGVVCDPFSGSGTTCHAAIENGRRFIGCDIRQSQIELCQRRMRTITPSLLAELN